MLVFLCVVSVSHIKLRVAGFVLSNNFQYFTGYDKHTSETKSAVGQTYCLLFCLPGSKKIATTKLQHIDL